MVILMPLMFSILFLGVQAALYFYARSVAITAAQQGAQAAAFEGASRNDGCRAAQAFLNRVGGGGVIDHAQVTCQRSATTTTVSVTGTSLSLVDGWSLEVHQQATSTVEKVT